MEPGQDMGTSSDPNSIGYSTTGRPQKTDHEKDSGSDLGEEDIPVSSMPRHDSAGQSLSVLGSSTGASADTEKQSSQTKDVEENGSSHSRIPSFVFASSANPMEWSTASNESLFSIYMGNTSFTGDYSMFLEKPDDIDVLSEPAPASASSQPNVEGTIKDEELQVNKIRAAETMKEVIQENAEKSDSDDKGAIAEVLPFGSSKYSEFGGVSTQSFAFQTPTGKGDKNESPTASHKGQRKQVHAQPKPGTEQDSPQSGPQTPQAQFNESQRGWFSCFSCCSSRS